MVGVTLGLTELQGARMLRIAVAAAPSPVLWYLTRAMAVTAYLALTLSVSLGILRTVARTSKESVSWLFDELHQVLATLACLLIIGHLVTLKFDPFLPFSVENLLLPLKEPYRPLAVTLGVFALYAMAVPLVSSWLRRRLPYGFWRSLHYVSFVAFALVTLHGLLAGSDAGEPWMRGIYAFASGAVAYLVVMRLVARRPRVSNQM